MMLLIVNIYRHEKSIMRVRVKAVILYPPLNGFADFRRKVLFPAGKIIQDAKPQYGRWI
jgi:hypothetical protein